eukprot:scaffold1090_cov118-Skeletonema_dohrnii-CCMP3373.AAC.7
MKYNCIGAALMLCCLAAAAPKMVASFATSNSIKFRIPQSAKTLQSQECNSQRTSSTALQMAHGKYGNGRSSSRYAAGDRTKRQERVGHVVRTELASILHKGFIRFDNDPIEDELRRRINIVHCDVSPDLRQARVTVSVMSGKDRKMDAIAKRRAYAWLVRSTKAIRHSLAQKMKHMKGSPDLTFVQVDVGAAVDVMQLIEKVSTGYKRDDVLEMEFEDDDDEDGIDNENNY